MPTYADGDDYLPYQNSDYTYNILTPKNTYKGASGMGAGGGKIIDHEYDNIDQNGSKTTEYDRTPQPKTPAPATATTDPVTALAPPPTADTSMNSMGQSAWGGGTGFINFSAYLGANANQNPAGDGYAQRNGMDDSNFADGNWRSGAGYTQAQSQLDTGLNQAWNRRQLYNAPAQPAATPAASTSSAPSGAVAPTTQPTGSDSPAATHTRPRTPFQSVQYAF